MAADVSARVHLVAEKLQQKAQDAQRKGNENAARALSNSVSDLREALALLSEQRHLLTRRRGEGDEHEDDADAHVQELATRLAKVEKMLGKKSDDMKQKGNENAAVALQQSAAAVEKGRVTLLEQQQTVFGLLGRWETLEGVVSGAKRRSSADVETDCPRGQLIAQVRHLVQIGALVEEMFPGCNEEEVREQVEEMKKAQEEALEVGEMLKQESLALEEARGQLERQSQREILRQEEDAMLLEQQREACQAMEELVRESDQEIQRMTQSAKVSAEEMQCLRVELESLVSEKERLVRAHAGEVEELQGQLASAMDAISSKEKSEHFDTEELQALQIKVDTLTSEKKDLVESHANEIEDLHQQLESATTSSGEIDAEELQSLQTKLDALVLEKENLIKIHADEAEVLRQVHADEIENIRHQLESSQPTQFDENATINADEFQSLQTKLDELVSENEHEVEELRQAHASDAKELQSLREAINNFTSEKEILVQVHATELEKLREAHRGEIEDLQHQLYDATAALAVKSEKVASTANELQQLRAEVGALTIEKDQLVKEHADGVEKLSQPRVEGAPTESRSVSEDHEDSAINGEADRESEEADDVPVLELEEDDSQTADIAAEDEVETGSSDADNAARYAKKLSEIQAALDYSQAQPAECYERSQAQEETISALEREQVDLQQQIEILTNEKTQSNDELQRAHEAEALKRQTHLDDLLAKVADYEQRFDVQQNTIMALEKEQLELEERVKLLTNEKAQVLDAMQNTHGEETTRLAQCVADNEATIEALTAQLQEANEKLTTKLAEQSEAVNALERSKAELHACRSEFHDQIRECNRLQNDLEAFQNAENVKNGEVDERLSQLTSELHEVVRGLSSDDKTVAARTFMRKVWQSAEITELCSGLAAILTNLESVQDQLHSTEQLLESSRNVGANQKLTVDQFIKTSDWRLFAKDNEAEEEVVEELKSGEHASELLAVAKANVLCWLDELQQLRPRVANDAVRFDELEQEKQQEQDRLVALEESKGDLEVLVESLREQLTAMRTENEAMVKAAKELKAQNHCASVQEQQQQAAQQEEVAELQQQLATVRSDFERYRVRSHTALKKMEKRAELLNGMRKENETLLQQVKESDRLRDQADAARKDSETQLQEVQRIQEMMQDDFDQVVMEKSRAVVELEEEQQRLQSEREQTDKLIEKLTRNIQELEREKTQIEEGSERIKEAEQAAFQARLSTATAAAQTAKQDLQQVHDALEASKTENEKRQKLVESLKLKLEQQPVVDTVAANTHISAPASYVPPLVSHSAEVKRNVAELEKEVVSLKASESSLREQLADARAELIALQERFATTKAANAEKVFALEERSNHWEMELAAATEEIGRLNAVVETQKNSIQQTQPNGSLSESAPNRRLIEQQHPAQVQELKTELADANTELALLTRALDTCREDLQEARGHLDALAPSSSEPESGEGPFIASKASRVLAAKDETLKKLRVQVLELQEELQTLHEEKATFESEREKEELDELQASRKHMQSEKERAMQLQRRQTMVSGFEKQLSTIVDELQQRLDDHSSAFREVCDFRDEHRATLFSDTDRADGRMTNAAANSVESEFEEYLVMRSGVVIKAGATFQLPVICEKRGWRIVWNFSVKEDAADVNFKLSATMADATSAEVEIVQPERMNEMSGVFQVQHDNTTLLFDWDNSFSWLNEKTLDYHVSIQEPLTPQVQKVRRSERDLQAKAKLLENGLTLVQTETKRRSELSATLKRLAECEVTKNQHLEQFGARKTDVLSQKTRFQEEMDAQKAAFSAMLREQDELEDVERSITRAWEAAVSEREDVEMTLQLAGNGAQLETLALELEEQMKSVAEQLKNSVRAENKVEGEPPLGEDKAPLAADLEELEQSVNQDTKSEVHQAERDVEAAAEQKQQVQTHDTTVDAE